MYVIDHTMLVSGSDLRNKGCVGHCAYVVEAGLATQHWSGKSEAQPA